MPSPFCKHPPREMWLALLDSIQSFPVSSGVGTQATRTLLGRRARMIYHTTIRPLALELRDDRLQ